MGTVTRLNVAQKTVNAPHYPYGSYRVWGDLSQSRYFLVTPDPRQDIFELLRLLALDGPPLKDKDRVTLAQSCQTIRGLKPQATRLLESFAATLEDEPRAKLVPNEEKLEKALYTHEGFLLRLSGQVPKTIIPSARHAESWQAQGGPIAGAITQTFHLGAEAL
jgi:hypothetical protein